MSKTEPTAEFEVLERHPTGGYQDVLVKYSREEIREDFGTDNSTLVSVLLNELEKAEATLKAVSELKGIRLSGCIALHGSGYANNHKYIDEAKLKALLKGG